MKKKVLFAAMALVALASCTSDEVVSLSSPPEPTPTDLETSEAIVFSSASKGITRADLTGADAAEKLGYKFVVSAKKGSTTAATNSAVTFDNYLVEYTENTAQTTASNSTNWEYVGKGRIKHAIDHHITSQTIKYWDYSQKQYDFIAWSTGSKTAIYEGTPVDGEVLVSAIDPNATATAAVTFEGKAEDLSQIYISDLTTVKKAQYGDTPVEMKFRQLGTKVRIGIYETIPGYSVRSVQFYTQGGILTDPSTEIVDKATIFSTAADIYTEGKYTVTYPTVDDTSDANNNQAHVTFTPKTGATQTTKVEWGSLNYTIAEEGEQTTGKVFLGRSSNTASFAGVADKNYYVTYLPNETGTNLNLRVDFILEATDGGGETINVKNAKAQVPSIYATWKPGFAYTYLFKISDKTNGRTGVYDPTKADDATVNSDPAGLYPITFDAVVVNAEEDGTQETITTVSTPSITTYQNGSTVVNNDEYTTLTPDPTKGITGDIFVTVNEGDALVTLTGKAALYTIPAGKTEADVIDALQMQDDDAGTFTIKGRNGIGLTAATTVSAATDIDAANKYALTNSVEFGADGNAISVGTDQALRFKPESGKTYAFVYTKTAATAANDVVKYQALNWSSFATGQTKYRYEYKAAEGTYCQKGVKYFSKNASDVYTMITAFVGQSVNNLYVKDGDNYVIASGLVVPGTKYYYTTDHGMTYKECYVVSYNTAKAAGKLYTYDGNTYTPKAAGAPVDGTAYYYLDGTEYKYAVIHPQKTDNLYELDETKYEVANETAEVVGQTYFDKYTKNDGEYYTKIIKVQ